MTNKTAHDYLEDQLPPTPFPSSPQGAPIGLMPRLRLDVGAVSCLAAGAVDYQKEFSRL
jgi:hypothetical protein